MVTQPITNKKTPAPRTKKRSAAPVQGTVEDFTKLVDRSTVVKELYGKRDKMLEDMRMMFHMEWQNAPSADWIKATMSPSAYNAATGAMRLLDATEPQFTVPYSVELVDAESRSERMEKAARAMWKGSNHVQSIPVQNDMVFAAVLFGELAGSVTKTSELVKWAAATKSPGQINRMNWIAQQSPYLFKTQNPQQCYPDFDGFGLRSQLYRAKRTWGEVLNTWGDAAQKATKSADRKDTDVVTVNDYYDWDWRAYWLDEDEGPIILQPNDLTFMPVFAQLSGGTMLFKEPELQRLPLLYGLLKSGLWNRENLTLTAVYSLIYALGTTPLLKRRTPNKGEPLVIDRSSPGGVVDVGPDEDIGPLGEIIVPPSLIEALNMAQNFEGETTIPKMALGAPPSSGVMAFSSISLLSQSGRLPLVAPKQAVEEMISDQMVTAMRWFKQDGGDPMNVLNRTTGAYAQLSPDDIPDQPVVNTGIEPDLPQDKLQLANVAEKLLQSDLVDREWIQSNLLNIGQSKDMAKRIYREKRQQFEISRRFKKIELADQIAIQQAVQQQQAQQQQAAAGQPQPNVESGAVPPGGVQPGQPLGAPLQPRGVG